MQDTQELTAAPEGADPDAAEDAAFEATGFKAAVFKPMFAHAHQQVFTPRWLCEALPPIAHHAFDFEGMIPEERRRLNVLDPTAGSGRLLVPFKQAGHHVFGVELDTRLAEIAAEALGKRAIRQGDIVAYGSLIPESRWQVCATNAPFALWWNCNAGYNDYELRSGEKFTVNVKTADRSPTQFTIAVVDEGLLDLTRFKTPDPWKYFFQKLRLGVETFDLFGYIIGANKGDVFRTFSIGGGRGYSDRGGRRPYFR